MPIKVFPTPKIFTPTCLVNWCGAIDNVLTNSKLNRWSCWKGSLLLAWNSFEKSWALQNSSWCCLDWHLLCFLHFEVLQERLVLLSHRKRHPRDLMLSRHLCMTRQSSCLCWEAWSCYHSPFLIGKLWYHLDFEKSTVTLCRQACNVHAHLVASHGWHEYCVEEY